jgi:hypothetical protein
MNLKYLHVDGDGKVCCGISASELAARAYCLMVFGELERPLEIGERINAVTGAIEPIPPTPDQITDQQERDQAKIWYATLKAGTATNAQVQKAVAFLIRRVFR